MWPLQRHDQGRMQISEGLRRGWARCLNILYVRDCKTSNLYGRYMIIRMTMMTGRVPSCSELSSAHHTHCCARFACRMGRAPKLTLLLCGQTARLLFVKIGEHSLFCGATW
jgi:hypothetical protein